MGTAGIAAGPTTHPTLLPPIIPGLPRWEGGIGALSCTASTAPAAGGAAGPAEKKPPEVQIPTLWSLNCWGGAEESGNS